MDDKHSGNLGLFDDEAFRKVPKKNLPKEKAKKPRNQSSRQREVKFFEKQKEQSQVKTKIVAGYFSAWATFMLTMNPTKLGYVDLFCGPGVYSDRNESTPIKILQTAISKPGLRERLTTKFNDKNAEFIASLEKAAKNLPGYDTLKYKPQFTPEEVEEKFAVDFEKMKMHPTVAFLDPCGYKGLSVRLMRSVFKDWGCDLIFFFNYNRVNMHCENPFMDENMKELFGERWINHLKAILNDEGKTLNREEIILAALKMALEEKGGKYFIAFRFREGPKTLHHIVFVSKNVLGYNIMKDIMARESIVDEDGIPKFEFDTKPIEEPVLSLPQLSMFPEPKLLTGLAKLCDLLCKLFKGHTLSVKDIFEKHNVDTNYIKRNYKDAIRILENDGRVRCNKPARERQKRMTEIYVNGKIEERKLVTVGDSVMVTFP